MNLGEVRCEGCVASVGEMRIEYRILVRKPEGNRPLATWLPT